MSGKSLYVQARAPDARPRRRSRSSSAASPGARTRPLDSGGRGLRLPPAVPSPRDRSRARPLRAAPRRRRGARLAAAGARALPLRRRARAAQRGDGRALRGRRARQRRSTAITAWKEILLAVALAARRAATPGATGGCRSASGVVDWLALAFAALVVVYALVPQSALDGRPGTARLRSGFATTSSRSARTSSGARSACAATTCAGSAGRCSATARSSRRSVSSTSTPCRSAGGARTASSTTSTAIWATTTTARACALDDDGAVYGLPENFIYNVGGDKPFLRRLVSTFLSPLASGYLFVVALLVAVAAMRRRALALAARRPHCSGLAVDVLALVARRARRRARRARARPPPPDRARSPQSPSSRSRSAGRTSSRRSGRPATGRRSTAPTSTQIAKGGPTEPFSGDEPPTSRRCTRTGRA